jgi:hypothetical protein
MSYIELPSDQRNVINWAKAVARALNKWRRSPTTENHDKLLDMTIRLVANLEKTEKREKDSTALAKDNVIQFRKRPRKP